MSTDNTNLPSNDNLHPTSIGIPYRTSIDSEPRAMVAPLILVRDNNGDLHDQEGHLLNAADQRIDAQEAAILGPDAITTGTALPVDEAAQPMTLADYNRPDRYYIKRSAILPPTLERDFEPKVQYYTLVGQLSYHGLSHEHPMDQLERFEDLTTYSASFSDIHSLEKLCIGSSSYNQDLLNPGAKSRMHSYAISLMRRVLKT